MPCTTVGELRDFEPREPEGRRLSGVLARGARALLQRLVPSAANLAPPVTSPRLRGVYEGAAAARPRTGRRMRNGCARPGDGGPEEPMADECGWQRDGSVWTHPTLPFRIEEVRSSESLEFEIRSRSGVLLAVCPRLLEAQAYCTERSRLLDGMT